MGCSNDLTLKDGWVRGSLPCSTNIRPQKGKSHFSKTKRRCLPSLENSHGTQNWRFERLFSFSIGCFLRFKILIFRDVGLRGKFLLNLLPPFLPLSPLTGGHDDDELRGRRDVSPNSGGGVTSRTISWREKRTAARPWRNRWIFVKLFLLGSDWTVLFCYQESIKSY